MTGFVLSKRSIKRMSGLHPLLSSVVVLALFKHSHIDFGVAADSVRTEERQIELVAEAKSKTLNSKHLIQPDTGCSHAVDLYPSGYNSISDIPREAWVELSTAMHLAAKDVGVKIRWGADWDMDGTMVDEDPDESFFDAPHFELVGV